MGSVIRNLEYDKETKIYGPRCHKCNKIMKMIFERLYGNLYKCECGAVFQEDLLS